MKNVVATEEVESVPLKAVTIEDTEPHSAEGGPIDKVDNNAKSVENDDNLPFEEVPCADSEEGPKDDGDENIERTVTAKTTHLRLGRSYYVARQKRLNWAHHPSRTRTRQKLYRNPSSAVRDCTSTAVCGVRVTEQYLFCSNSSPTEKVFLAS